MSLRPDRRAPLVAIVDDEVDIVTYLRLALEDQGFEVLEITDAERALDQLRAAGPDLICLDLLMPRHGGISVYSEVLEEPGLEGCPVVMMSGLEVRSELPALLERAGGLPLPVAFVEKPIDIGELLAVIVSVVRPEKSLLEGVGA